MTAYPTDFPASTSLCTETICWHCHRARTTHQRLCCTTLGICHLKFFKLFLMQCHCRRCTFTFVCLFCFAFLQQLFVHVNAQRSSMMNCCMVRFASFILGGREKWELSCYKSSPANLRFEFAAYLPDRDSYLPVELSFVLCFRLWRCGAGFYGGYGLTLMTPTINKAGRER